ncbi:hypothetical protein AB2F40_18845 [Escherichia coli]
MLGGADNPNGELPSYITGADNITVTDAWLRAHPDDVEVIPLCRIPPRQHSHEQHIEELRAALARMLHMHHMMLETTHYRENITDARCIREMHEAPLQALNILARYPHKKDEV